MYVLIVLAVIVLIVGIVLTTMAFNEDIELGIWALILSVFVVIIFEVLILSPILVLDKSSGMTIGTITSVDKNFWGSTAIYLKTAETTQEKYCAENEEIIEFAKNNIGKKVKIGYGTRVGFYKLSQCDQAPIEHIERVEEINMSAKEMFEELGYECDVSYDGILYSKYKDLPNGGVANCHIDFDKVNKIIEKDESEAGFSHKHYNSKITFEELQAINKQIEELGWLGDKE